MLILQISLVQILSYQETKHKRQPPFPPTLARSDARSLPPIPHTRLRQHAPLVTPPPMVDSEYLFHFLPKTLSYAHPCIIPRSHSHIRTLTHPRPHTPSFPTFSYGSFGEASTAQGRSPPLFQHLLSCWGGSPVSSKPGASPGPRNGTKPGGPLFFLTHTPPPAHTPFFC